MARLCWRKHADGGVDADGDATPSPTVVTVLSMTVLVAVTVAVGVGGNGTAAFAARWSPHRSCVALLMWKYYGATVLEQAR